MTDPDPSGEDLDALMAALARLRGGGRGPFGGPFGPGRGPFAGGRWPDGADPREDGTSRERGGPHGRGGHGGTRGRAGGRGHGPFDPDTHGPGPFGGIGPGGRLSAPARLRLLEALAAASRPLSVSEVGEAIGVDQPRASRLIQQAVERGMVRREADPDDARRTRVALTDEGARLAHGLRGRRREQLSSALAEFTEQERADLVRLLAKLAAAWPDPPAHHGP